MTRPLQAKDFLSCFFRSMEGLGPFEDRPSIAAAVSGGPDSMALGHALLKWVEEKKGELFIFTVDHGLRPGSAGDCAFVRDSFSGIPHAHVEILRWEEGAKENATSLQARARVARYALLSERCRELGILHLCTGHTLDDQAETFSMRKAHGSTKIGLASMPSWRPLNGVRLLRPLLGMQRDDLAKWLQETKRNAREDPSNLLDRFERTRHRREIRESGKARLFAEEAQALGFKRDRLEREVTRLLVASLRLEKEGYAKINIKVWREASDEVIALAWSYILKTIGGKNYSPGPKAIQRLSPFLLGQPGPRTLSGCVVFYRQKLIYVCKEAADCKDIVEGKGEWVGRWDQRFDISIAGLKGEWQLSVLGEKGLQELAHQGVSFRRHPIPLAARQALPAIWVDGKLTFAPYIKWGKGGEVSFLPNQSLTGVGFPVADIDCDTIL